jgi:hypothetical protein
MWEQLPLLLPFLTLLNFFFLEGDTSVFFLAASGLALEAGAA